ncbi:cell adhesion molecule Dscam2-like isoform X2 [Planococcus citri]|uniref:cell adhesion molecule Dscam2-like isoform X2 n=1 Tax=Planococcus citri TaxID=170843 RepID=UPI0031F920E0
MRCVFSTLAVVIITGISYTNTSYLTGPVFLVEPPPFIHLVNSSRGALLNCLGQGNPHPSIQWLDQDHQEVTTIPGLREILPNGSLYFPPFSIPDYRSDIHSSTYSCSLTNIVGSVISRECHMHSDNSLPFKLQVHNVFVMRGNTALLRCYSPNLVHNSLIQMSWFKEEPLNGKSSIQSGGKYIITMEGDLHVRDVSDSDSNVKFFCDVTNKLTGQSVQSQPGQIILVEPQENFAPKIEHTSAAEFDVRVGQTVDLFCLAQGTPPPTYRWYREVGNVLQEIHSVSILLRVQESILHFPRVQLSDSSNYVCIASNSLGEDRKKLKLKITSEVIVFVRPQKQVVDSGSSATFNCSIHGGRGQLIISWLKNGHTLPLSSKIDVRNNGELLTIHSVSREDKGMYQCFVRNKDESAQNSGELILGAVAPELKYMFSEQTLQPGRPVSLKCIASGNPHARILWYLDGGLLFPQGDYILGSYVDDNENVVSHLNISNVRVQHGGLYTCTARNTFGSAQHSALLNIHGSPISRQMMNLTVVSGSNVYLRCPASGYPIVSTTWQYAGKQLTSESRHRVFGNGTLMIKEVMSQKDQGEYTCTIRNRHEQSAMGKLFLTIMEPPEVQPFQFDNDLKEGNRAHVSCAIKSGDLPMEFMWKKDGRPLPHDLDVQQQNLQFVSNLYFSKLSARHSGYYTCIVSNEVAVANFTAHLRIKVSPVWTIEPMDTSVLFEQPVILNCQVSGFPTPTVTWKKASETNSLNELDQSNDIVVINNGSLIINSAERHHEGYYQCTADNGIGKSLTKTVSLRVNVPAHFRVKFINQSGIAGDKMVLTCEAEGDQPLRVTWNTPPPAPIHTRHTPTGLASELHLNYLSRSYAGIYHCTATNSFGYDHMSIHLTVKELPETPQNVEVTDIESRSLKLKWEEVPGPLTSYLVQYHEENSDSWKNMTVTSSSLSARLISLTPSTKYAIKVMAINELGSSDPSKTITVYTLEEAPSGPPLNVEVNVNENSLIVQWQPPLDEDTNGAVLGYEVEYREIGSPSTTHRKTVKAHKNSVELAGLKYYTTYEITVKAFNRVGVGPATLPIQQITTESVPTGAPQKLKCSAMSSESLRIQWEIPPPDYHNGNLQGYKIFYKPANPEIGMKTLNSVKKTISLDTSLYNLEKYTNYSVRVLAYTRAGDGVKSPPVYCHTAEDLPEAPATIKALVMTSDSILITWSSPVRTNGVILKYHVYIEHPNKKVHKEVVYGETNVRYIYRNLKEDQYYIFWVVASTSVGEGPPSSKESQTPLSRVPARIASFSGKVMSKIGTRVSLDCFAVGLPSPTRIWRGPSSSSLMPAYKKNSDAVLWLGPISENEAGNYTCQAENVFGKDEVTFQLTVLLPPLAPVLYLSSQSSSSIAVSWKPTGNGGSPITGYLLSYQANDRQNWENIDLESEVESFEIKQLQCGTEYQIYVQAMSSVGYSSPSQTLNIKTKGTVPEMAPQHEIMSANSTSVSLYLDNWSSAECPVQYFKVAYRNSSKWIFIEPSRIAPETVVIGGLKPAAKYTLRITAVNEAGASKFDYVFATRTESGDLIPIEMMKEPEVSMLSQLNTIIPIVSAVLCVVAISACVFILFQKRKLYGGYKSGQQTLETSHIDYDHERTTPHQRPYLPSPVGKENPMNTINRDDVSALEYDVCPYATFSLPSQATSHPVKLRSFNQHDCYETAAIMDGHHSIPKRPKLIQQKCPPGDDYNLEISCISNQQTLPVGGKSRSISTPFMSDSDSSTGKLNQRRYQQIQKDVCPNPQDIDSSTESIETSPVIKRKMMPKRIYMR